MSVADIRQMIETWRDAAVRSIDAGFDICEIHGAHGYLIHQFLSPLANRRNDGYGGRFEGRMRFALEIAEAVRAVWPQDRPLFFRCSATDGPGLEWTIEDTVVLSRELMARGVDVITCSSGGIAGPINTALVPRTPGYHVAYADRVRREVGIKTVAVGSDYRSASCRADSLCRTGGSDRACTRASLQPALARSCCESIGDRELSRHASTASLVLAEAARRSSPIEA